MSIAEISDVAQEPKSGDRPDWKPTSFRIRRDDYPRWLAAAKTEERDLSNFIRRAVNQYIATMISRGELPPE